MGFQEQETMTTPDMLLWTMITNILFCYHFRQLVSIISVSPPPLFCLVQMYIYGHTTHTRGQSRLCLADTDLDERERLGEGSEQGS